MRIFVTGASGVIGSRVVPALLTAGHEVTAVMRSAAKGEATGAAGRDDSQRRSVRARGAPRGGRGA